MLLYLDNASFWQSFSAVLWEQSLDSHVAHARGFLVLSAAYYGIVNAADIYSDSLFYQYPQRNRRKCLCIKPLSTDIGSQVYQSH